MGGDDGQDGRRGQGDRRSTGSAWPRTTPSSRSSRSPSTGCSAVSVARRGCGPGSVRPRCARSRSAGAAAATVGAETNARDGERAADGGRATPPTRERGRPRRSARARRGGRGRDGRPATAVRAQRPPRGAARATDGSADRTARTARRTRRSIRPPSGAAAVGFVEGLVDAFGVRRHDRAGVDDSEFEVRVAGDDLGLLIGPGGARCWPSRISPGSPPNAGSAITTRACGSTSPATASGAGRRSSASPATSPSRSSRAASPLALEPMPSADRKIIHDALPRDRRRRAAIPKARTRPAASS